MKDLIGLQFKRNVYGPSIWTDVVENIWIKWKFDIPYNGTQKPEIMIIGENTGKIGLSFSLDEVIFVRPLDPVQQIVLRKQEHHAKIQKEWIDKQKYNTT